MPSPFVFRPRLVDALRGYDAERFTRDLGAGLTVGVVALPLAMAFAIASGLQPQAGLWTAIVAGLLISLLGGSSVQIGGPAGAFIVVVYGIVQRHGVGGLMVATSCAGLLLLLLGALRLGRLVRYVPLSIVVGFTNGIAVLIAASQLKDWLGLPVAKMPADFFGIVGVVAGHLEHLNLNAIALGLVCFAGLFVWPLIWHEKSSPVRAAFTLPGMSGTARLNRRVPAPVVALVTLTLLAWSLQLPVETIGQRFGNIPQELPAFQAPQFSWDNIQQLAVPIVTLAMLGAIESLLCARVADQLSPLPRHDPDQELMAQGIANMVTPFVGGMPATGTIARTVTNVRNGATSPVAGIVHALTIAAVVLLAAPLALHVPLAVLAGILLFVAFNMGEWQAFSQLRSETAQHRLLMLGTFVLTIVFDLTVAVLAGLATAGILARLGLPAALEPETQPPR